MTLVIEAREMLLASRILFPVLVALFASLYVQPLTAQTVSVRNGEGQHGHGWLFMHAGTCHVVMPRHVAGVFPRVTLSTAEPVESASAAMLTPFWEGIDLAVGVVRGSLSDRCTGTLDELEEDSRSINAAEGELLRLGPSGDIERTNIRIMNRGYLTFDGIVDSSETDIVQGTSGSFVFVRGRPIGMAVTSTGTDRATFIRSGEMLIHLHRFLSQQGGAYLLEEDSDASGSSSAPTDVNALPLVFHSASVPPINPRFAPENMTGPGPFVFAPARQVRFVFGFKPDRTNAVSRIVITSTPGTDQTMPKNIILRASVSREPGGFGQWMRGSFASDGIFDTNRIAKRNVRWIEIIVLDTWGGGDVLIDEVSAY